MILKKFTAPTYDEAVLQAKLELGSDIRILQRRSVRIGGWFGFFTRECIEILATLQPKRTVETLPQKQFLQELNRIRSAASPARTVEDKNRQSAASEPDPHVAPATPDTRFSSVSESPKQEISEFEPSGNNESEHMSSVQSSHAVKDPQIELLLKDMSSLRKEVEQIEHFTKDFTPKTDDSVFDKLRNYMRDMEFASDQLSRVMDIIDKKTPPDRRNDECYVRGQFRNILMEELKADKDIIFDTKPKIIALTGPTGVGKTTTVAKLAYHYQLQKFMKVAFINLDTYRIGSTEQLEEYSTLLEVPIASAFNIQEFTENLEKFSDMDLILVDTAGRSPNNLREMEELAEYLKVCPEMEIQLVLGSIMNHIDMIKTYEKFSSLNISKLVFTKLDECTIFGPMISTQLNIKLPVAYLTDGQSAPENIVFTSPRALSTLVLPDL